MVQPGGQERYRGLLLERAAEVRGRGARFWAFQSRVDPGVYLEFVEAGEETGARTEREIALERMSRTVAAYAPDSDDVWEEVECREG